MINVLPRRPIRRVFYSVIPPSPEGGKLPTPVRIGLAQDRRDYSIFLLLAPSGIEQSQFADSLFMWTS